MEYTFHDQVSSMLIQSHGEDCLAAKNICDEEALANFAKISHRRLKVG